MEATAGVTASTTSVMEGSVEDAVGVDVRVGDGEGSAVDGFAPGEVQPTTASPSIKSTANRKALTLDKVLPSLPTLIAGPANSQIYI